jgi:hypothetical protein
VFDLGETREHQSVNPGSRLKISIDGSMQEEQCHPEVSPYFIAQAPVNIGIKLLIFWQLLC